MSAYMVWERSYTALMISDVPAEHPAGFDFDYSYWFDCKCGRRVQVSATAYDLQCSGDEPYPVCNCDTTIDIAAAHPALRDLDDIDCQDEQVDQHLWYHTSIYQDWPSPTYHDDIAAQLKHSPLPTYQHEKIIEAKTSLALHLGTYAAAIDNMLRRMRDQDSPSHQYWLHQVQIRLQHADLARGIHSELCGWFGDVPMTALADLGARAARYVNVHEAPGSISLAVDPHVIMRVRTIPLTLAAVLPAAEASEQVVDRVVADLRAAQQLRPDTTGIPKDQVFESELDIFRAEMSGRTVSDEAKKLTKQLTPQFRKYHRRESEIWSNLQTTLTDMYLAHVTPRLRDRLLSVIPADIEPGQYHQRLRELAGLMMQPHAVLGRFETASWRTLEPTSYSVPSESDERGGQAAE
ncbi:hypothetical protein AB0C34_29470 [Nocardia sp. NPDC049220]|uniref:hypothetical protein n=1 Tax=Nocardia sp. NPDC049220 TaxID=3155273 RepID=UPI0033E9A42F